MLLKEGSVIALFGLRILLGLAIIAASARFLPAPGFAIFTQFLIFAAYVNTISTGGIQTGLIREFAAAPGAEHRGGLLRAAALIWTLMTLAVAAVAAIFAGPLSVLLAGTPDHARLVITLALLSSLSGVMQLCASCLSGAGRTATSMAVQAAGLLAGGLGCLFFLVKAMPGEALIAMGAGNVLGAAAGLAAVARLNLPSADGAVRTARFLARYSGHFIAVASLAPAALFTMRFLYRDQFGVDALSDWLLANRISDTTTQVLALLGTHVFMPGYVLRTGSEARRFALRTFAGLTLMMAAIPLVFAFAGPAVTALVIGSTGAGAVAAIQLYLVGDVLRVAAMMAHAVSVARGRLIRSVFIELTVHGLTLGLYAAAAWQGTALAPYIGYIGANLLVTAAVAVAFLTAKGGSPQGKKAQGGPVAPPDATV